MMVSSSREHPMEENPSRLSRRDGSHEASKGGGGGGGGGPSCSSRIRSRYTVDEDGDEYQGGDLIECSGKYCKSCTAGLIADCVALCCCPCALVNFFALAFVRVPYMVGRRCLGRVRRKRKKKKQQKQQQEEMKRKCKKKSEGGGDDDEEVAEGGDGNLLRKGRVEEGMKMGIGSVEEEEEEEGRGSTARLEAERVWLEMYQVGQLGFGRVSFSGNNY